MVKSTNEILSEILSIITSGIPMPSIQIQLDYIMRNQVESNELQEQILQYINKISEDSDTGVDLLRTFIQIFSSYRLDMHSFYQDWLTNIIAIKTNQNITNHLTLAIKSDTETMNNLMESSKQQMNIMSLMMCQELSNTNNISILTDLTGQTLYSIKSLLNSVEKINDNVESINKNVQKINDINDNVSKINDNVSKINGKIPEPGPGPIPPIPPTPPTPPVPPIPPKPRPEFLFYCEHCNRMVTNCPQTGRKMCTYETKSFPVYDPKNIIRERDFNKWLNDKN